MPVLEAMHFGLPVVSCDATALADTVGTGGILVHEKRYPELAELFAEVAQNKALRDHLIQLGHQRVKELSFERFEERASQLFSANSFSTTSVRRVSQESREC